MASSLDAAHRERRPKSRVFGHAFQYVWALNGGDHCISQGGERMIRGSQEDAAETYTVAGNRKGDDLTCTIGQQLVTAGPATLENERLVPGLSLLNSCLPRFTVIGLDCISASRFSSSGESGRNVLSFLASTLSNFVSTMTNLH